MKVGGDKVDLFLGRYSLDLSSLLGLTGVQTSQEIVGPQPI